MTQKKEFELQVLEGRPVRVYASGLVLDDDTGKIIKPAPGTVIRSPERAAHLRRKRQEKVARLSRRTVLETHNSTMPNPAKDSAEAFSYAVGMLHEQIVLNSEAYPRDRLEALEKIGKWTELLPADRKQAEEDSAAAARLQVLAAGLSAETAATLARLLSDVMRVQGGEPIAIEGKVIPDPE